MNGGFIMYSPVQLRKISSNRAGSTNISIINIIMAVTQPLFLGFTAWGCFMPPAGFWV